MGRGLGNVGLCWLEVPYGIEQGIADNGDDLLSLTIAGAFGAVNGGIQGLNRMGCGFFEVVLSPFPPYEPLMRPALPPYLTKKARAEKKGQVTDDGDGVRE